METTKDGKYFPIFISLQDKKILIVGGGSIAERRTKVLLEFQGNITMISEKLTPELEVLWHNKLLEYMQMTVNDNLDFLEQEKWDMVLIATDDEVINTIIAERCKELGIMMNTAHDKTMCDFYFPGIATKDNVVVGVSASGTDHKKASEVTRKLKELL